MAVKRVVSTAFWTDDTVVEEFSPEDKYFMLYLLTNPYTTQLGIYKISRKAIAFDMGYSVETVSILLDRFERVYDMLRYNKETHEVAIKNQLRHSILTGGKPVEDLLRKEMAAVKDKSLIDYMFNAIKDCPDLNDTVKKVVFAYLNESADESSYESSHESSNESYHESGYDLGGININNHNQDHKVVVIAGARACAREEEPTNNNDDDYNPFGDGGPDKPDMTTLEAYAANNVMNMYNGYNMDSLLAYRDELPDDLIRFGIDLANKYCKSGAPTFAYVDRILKGFVQRKLKTVEQARAAEEARQGSNGARSSPKQQPSTKTDSERFWANVPFY